MTEGFLLAAIVIPCLVIAIVFHEVAHGYYHLGHAAAAGEEGVNMPVWFAEGFATYFDGAEIELEEPTDLPNASLVKDNVPALGAVLAKCFTAFCPWPAGVSGSGKWSNSARDSTWKSWSR